CSTICGRRCSPRPGAASMAAPLQKHRAASRWRRHLPSPHQALTSSPAAGSPIRPPALISVSISISRRPPEPQPAIASFPRFLLFPAPAPDYGPENQTRTDREEPMGQASGRKSIFITGAASGMGLETARLFAGKASFVGGYDVNEAG